jgi:hypothetical protein
MGSNFSCFGPQRLCSQSGSSASASLINASALRLAALHISIKLVMFNKDFNAAGTENRLTIKKQDEKNDSHLKLCSILKDVEKKRLEAEHFALSTPLIEPTQGSKPSISLAQTLPSPLKYGWPLRMQRAT